MLHRSRQQADCRLVTQTRHKLLSYCYLLRQCVRTYIHHAPRDGDKPSSIALYYKIYPVRRIYHLSGRRRVGRSDGGGRVCGGGGHGCDGNVRGSDGGDRVGG